MTEFHEEMTGIRIKFCTLVFAFFVSRDDSIILGQLYNGRLGTSRVTLGGKAGDEGALGAGFVEFLDG